MICLFNFSEHLPQILYFLLFFSYSVHLYFLSLPSSTSSLKAQLVLSFLTTELPRGSGKSALSITPFSGKNWLVLIAGSFCSGSIIAQRTSPGIRLLLGRATLYPYIVFFSYSSMHKAFHGQVGCAFFLSLVTLDVLLLYWNTPFLISVLIWWIFCWMKKGYWLKAVFTFTGWCVQSLLLRAS